ncbi:MAG: UDP-N-acetylmuramoyl-tripeptide--D-alanyl-D-alanine ligase [Phycisphaerales bacterium]|nr:UDP-N-acetylmuramoyl-tripeptide--D-alanyl-D-alanine ligase [Phycisphaerales bacterium]
MTISTTENAIPMNQTTPRAAQSAPFMTPDELCAAVGGTWALKPQASGATLGIGTDTRSDLGNRIFFALTGPRHDAHDHLLEAARSGARILVVEESKWGCVRLTDAPSTAVLLVKDTRAALAATAQAWRRGLLGTQVIAITGSAGKTTSRRLAEGVLATRLTGSASPKSFNNDIGVPITICGAHRGDDFLLVEIGMNAPGEVAQLGALAAPDIAVITMIGKAHLEGLGSVDAIIREKFELVSALRCGGLAVVRGDNTLLDSALEGAKPTGVRAVRFGVGPLNHVRLRSRSVRREGGQDVVAEVCGRRLAFSLALEGAHNAMNAMAAIAIGVDRGLGDEEIARGLASVRPSDMRFVRQSIGGLTIFNDAYNANPDAVMAALSAFAELAPTGARRVTVLGDMLELGAAGPALHEEIGRAVGTGVGGPPPDVAIFVGALSAHAAHACADRASCKVMHVPDLSAASVTAVIAELLPGDAVLLKGSRGIALERLLASLYERLAA